MPLATIGVDVPFANIGVDVPRFATVGVDVPREEHIRCLLSDWTSCLTGLLMDLLSDRPAVEVVGGPLVFGTMLDCMAVLETLSCFLNFSLAIGRAHV